MLFSTVDNKSQAENREYLAQEETDNQPCGSGHTSAQAILTFAKALGCCAYNIILYICLGVALT